MIIFRFLKAIKFTQVIFYHREIKINISDFVAYKIIFIEIKPVSQILEGGALLQYLEVWTNSEGCTYSRYSRLFRVPLLGHLMPNTPRRYLDRLAVVPLDHGVIVAPGLVANKRIVLETIKNSVNLFFEVAHSTQ